MSLENVVAKLLKEVFSRIVDERGYAFDQLRSKKIRAIDLKLIKIVHFYGSSEIVLDFGYCFLVLKIGNSTVFDIIYRTRIGPDTSLLLGESISLNGEYFQILDELEKARDEKIYASFNLDIMDTNIFKDFLDSLEEIF